MSKYNAVRHSMHQRARIQVPSSNTDWTKTGIERKDGRRGVEEEKITSPVVRI